MRQSTNGDPMIRPQAAASLMAGLVMLMVAGCAGDPAAWRQAATGEAAACLADFTAVDRAVSAAGAGDAQSARITGFPYLRVSRFLASFRDQVDGPAFDAWVARLAALDAGGRRIELANLAAAPVPAGRLAACRELLLRHDMATASSRPAGTGAARVPDGYRDSRRLIGLYPLTAPPIAWGHWRWRQRQVADLQADYRPRGVLVDYAPTAPAAKASIPWAVDDLGVPVLDAGQQAALLAAHAPVLRVDTTGAADRPGTLAWSGGAPQVAAPATAYALIAFTRWHGQVLPQLVYVFWFPERPRKGRLDLLAGPLDGLMWRVTLDAKGAPLVYDSIHPCGCYHLFFPRPGLVRRDRWSIYNEGATVPLTAPRLAAGQRIVLTVDSGSHYIKQVTAETPGPATPYAIAPYDELRSLPWGAGRRSLFAPDGLIPASRRPERHVFWPMGIKSAGAMRQWGHHATAFVGKRHFDDPFLLEQTFGAAP